VSVEFIIQPNFAKLRRAGIHNS